MPHATAILERREPGVIIGSFAADHVISGQHLFHDAVAEAVVAAEREKLEREQRLAQQRIQQIADRTDGVWKPSPGSVYPTLQQLVDEDLVVSSGDGRKTLFELTDAGKAETEAKADEIAAALDGAPGIPDAQREFFEALRKTMGVLHMYRSTATEEQAKAATAKVDQLRKDLLQILAD